MSSAKLQVGKAGSLPRPARACRHVYTRRPSCSTRTTMWFLYTLTRTTTCFARHPSSWVRTSSVSSVVAGTDDLGSAMYPNLLKAVGVKPRAAENASGLK